MDQQSKVGHVPQPILDQMHDYHEGILRKGLEIAPDILNSIYPELGTMFRDKTITFMSIAVETENIGIDIRRRGGQPEMTLEISRRLELSRKLDNEWSDCYNAHYDEIVKASYTADHS